MKNKNREKLIKLLAEYQIEEKVRAKGDPSQKVLEEAAEVILADLQGLNTEEEEKDLLMCLITRELNLQNWLDKLWKRNRTLLPAQKLFLRQLGYI